MTERTHSVSPNRLGAYVSLVRLPNCLMIGLAVIVGESIGLGTIPPVDRMIYGFLTAALMMAGTMVLNDIYDLDIDRLNSPERALPSGRVTTRSAYYLAFGLSGASIFFSLLLGPYSLGLALLALILMVYYNLRGKKTGLPGNIVVSFNVALPFVFGGVSVSSFQPILLYFSILAFLSNLGRELVKGIVDVEGDRMHGVRTLAVLKGSRVTAITATGLFLSAVLVSLLPVYLGIVTIWYVPVVLLSDLGFTYSSASILTSSNVENARRTKNIVLVWMLLGLVAFLVGGLVH